MAGGREGAREGRRQVLLFSRMLSVRLLALHDSFNSFQFCPNRLTTNFFLLQNLCLKKSCEDICNKKTWPLKFCKSFVTTDFFLLQNLREKSCEEICVNTVQRNLKQQHSGAMLNS